MNYQRSFSLKSYWRKFLKKIKRPHERTEFYEWDNRKWILGGNSVVIKPEEIGLFIKVNLDKVFQRQNLALKVFYKSPLSSHDSKYEYFYVVDGEFKLVLTDPKMEQAKWGKGNLLETTKIQNLLALQGLSSRVYSLVFLVDGDKKYPAQVVEYLESETAWEERPEVIKATNDKVLSYCEEVGIYAHDIGDGKNMRNGLFVDTEEFKFTNYEEGLKKRLDYGLAYAGDVAKGLAYQSVEELGIKGARINSEREKFLKIEANELPPNFTILDFGCNGAYFLRRAIDKGATYAVGVDVPRVNEAARELNNYLGYFNMDFVDHVPDREFDVVLLLSAFTYAKVDEIFPKAKVAYIEGHCLNAQHTEEYYRNILKKYYKNIRVLGWVQDDPVNPPRVVMKAWR